MKRVRLGDTARFINGAAFKPSDWADDGLPIIRIQNLTGTGETFNRTNRVVKPDLVVESGDLLVSWSATLDAYRWSGPRGVLNQHIFKVLPKDGVRADYLYYALREVIAELETKTHGSTMKHVVRGDFESTLIPLPSIPEQDRIVDLLSRADNIVRMRREAEGKAKEIIPALFVEMFGDPTTNANGETSAARPERLAVERLGDVADVASGVAKGRKLVGKATREVPYLRVANVQAGSLNLSEMKYIPATESEIEELSVHAGDVLLTEGGDFDKVGRGALLEDEIGECIHQNHVFRVRGHSGKLISEYFAAFLQTSAARQYFLKAAKKTSNLASINMTQLKNLPLPVPHLDKQMEFRARFRSARSLEQQQARAMIIADAAFQSLLAWVFGEAKT